MTHQHFQVPVERYMTAPVRTIHEQAELQDAERILRGYELSSLAVVDNHEKQVGVITRTDLLRVGQTRGAYGKRLPVLELPKKLISEVMTKDIIAVELKEPVRHAAQLIVQKHIHRVFVQDKGKLVGVFSTRDAMVAVKDAKVALAVGDFMSSPVETVKALEPISVAIERFSNNKISGLLVNDEFEFPVGLFTQVEALQTKDLPAHTPVEDIMSYALLCVDVKTPIHRAAGYAAEARARRVIVVEHRKVLGMLTGFDFARVAAR